MTKVVTYLNTTRTKARKASAPIVAVDPIHAAISAWAKAYAAFEAVVADEEILEDKIRPIEKRLGVHITTVRPSFDIGVSMPGALGFTTTHVEDASAIRKHFTNKRRSDEGRPGYVTKSQWRKICAAEERKALKRLRRGQRELSQLQKKHGWKAHQDRYDAVGDVEQTALRKLARTVPTTAEGVAALAAWAAEHYHNDLAGTRWHAPETVYRTIARAVKRLNRTK